MEIKYTRDLTESEISLSFATIRCLFYLKHLLLFILNRVEALTPISKQRTAEVLLTCLKPHHDGYWLIRWNMNFLFQHNIAHLFINICLGELHYLFL